jgi:nitrous oxidase accessory protein NosD
MVSVRAAAASLIASVCLVAVAIAPGTGAAVAAKPVCAKVASPNGDDSASGAAGRPYATVQRLVDSLAAGETGCLRAGTYRQDEFTLATPGIRLTSYPGERAILAGRLRVNAEGITIDHLTLDGRNLRDLPSPTINADGVTFRDNDMANRHTSSCLVLGGTTEVKRPLIKRNRIHDCGVTTTNFDHGIYMNDVDNARIIGNTIYRNGSRGIKVGPDSQGALIRGNVIDGNPVGVSFSGGESSASSRNVVTRNVISNSTRYWNVQSYWQGPVGSGNVVSRNCVYGGNPDPHYNERGGISEGPGFAAVANLTASPAYVNRQAKDLRLRRDSMCRAVYGSAASRGASPLLGPALELRQLIEGVLAFLE